MDQVNLNDWPERAACKNASLDLFFPHRSNCIEAYRANEFCQACDVRGDCLKAGLDGDRSCGVWGGHYFDQGVHRPIPAPGSSYAGRTELAEIRRRKAYQQWLDLRAEGLRESAAYKVIAAEYGVSVSSVREWISKGRAESLRNFGAARKPADAP